MSISNNQIRSSWLLSFVIVVTSNLLLTAFNLIKINDLASNFILDFMIYGSAEGFWGWITYHFAYKKSGSKWLTWLTLSTPFAILFSVIALKIQQPISFTYLSVNFIGLLPKIWFWLHCIKLRKANLEIQKDKELRIISV
jgi:hypothetical protein